MPAKILSNPLTLPQRSADSPSARRSAERKERSDFMGLSVSNSLSIVSQAAANLSPAAAPRPTAAQPTTNNPQDTVKLSSAQQVEQLYNQGQSVPEISTSLSLAQNVVNLYLGISGPGSST
jgi:hypothetical protein